jgi:hypothetical protein
MSGLTLPWPGPQLQWLRSEDLSVPGRGKEESGTPGLPGPREERARPGLLGVLG